MGGILVFSSMAHDTNSLDQLDPHTFLLESGALRSMEQQSFRVSVKRQLEKVGPCSFRHDRHPWVEIKVRSARGRFRNPLKTRIGIHRALKAAGFQTPASRLKLTMEPYRLTFFVWPNWSFEGLTPGASKAVKS